MDILLRPWKHYADFEGRARRTEYFLFWIMLWVLTFVGLFVLGILAGIASATRTGEAAEAAVGFIVLGPLALFWLAALVPSIAVTVRRVHDHGQSGWLAALTWLPFVGWIFVLVFGFIPGASGPNRYGPDPRGGAQHLERVFG